MRNHERLYAAAKRVAFAPLRQRFAGEQTPEKVTAKNKEIRNARRALRRAARAYAAARP
jgi:hypothetical protein